MRVKSKLLASVLSLLMVVFCLVGLSACSCGGSGDCAHAWGKWTTITDATCTEDGVQERVCAECGEKETSAITAPGHTWEEATCTTPKTCSVCSETEGEVGAHVYDKNVVTDEALKAAATCGHPAIYYKSCTCGAISTSASEVFKDGAALAHTYDKEAPTENALKTAATCTEAAVYYKSCVCGAVNEDENATFTYGTTMGHSFTLSDAKDATLKTAATCTNAAVYYKSCACGAVSKSPADTFTVGGLLSHTYDKDVAMDAAFMSAATCESAAKYHKSCSCGAISDDEDDVFTVGSPSAHIYNEVSSTPATCSTAATATYRCDCGDEYEETVGGELGHLLSSVMPVEGEENEAVYEKYISGCEYVVMYVCQRTDCGEHVEGEHVYKHTYVASVTKEATCTQEGEKTLTCTTCNDTKTTKIAPDTQNGHTWAQGTVENGVRTDNCECGATKKVTVYDGNAINANNLKDTEVALDNGASFNLDGGVVDALNGKDVTLGADTLTDSERNNLELTEEQKNQIGDQPIYNFTINDGTENIGQFGENNYITVTLPYDAEGKDVDSIAIWFINEEGEVESIKATYSNGYVTFKTNHFSYYTVTRLTPQERCALYGHSYVHQHVNGNCLKDEYDLNVCVRCHDKYIDEETYIKADGHDYVIEKKEATCTENGYVLNTCKDCGHNYKTKIAAIGHDWEEIAHADSTCAENGYTTYKCDNCEEEYTVTFAKSAHIYTSTVIAPTCDREGYTLYDCDNCDYSYMDNYVAVLGHSYQANWNWAADYSSATLVLICENNVMHKITLKADVGMSVVKGMCSDFVRTTYTATAPYNGEVYTDVQVKEEGSVGHAFSAVWSKNEKEHWHECVCGATSDFGAHDFSNVTVTKAATCGEAGEGTATCVCGYSKVVVIPATGNHNYEDGICTECGVAFVDAYYVTLMNSWKDIEGFAIKLQDFSMEVKSNETDNGIGVLDSFELIGKITQIDFTELAIYFEDGEIGGAGRGSVVIYNGPIRDEDAVCTFKAVIHDEYLYVDANYGNENEDNPIKIKMSVDAAIEALLDEMGMSMGENTSAVLDFFQETVIPTLDKFVQANATKIDGVLEDVFNMFFTFNKQNDGSVVASLDYAKLHTLNNDLATKPIAEVVDTYFGAGAFNSVADFAREILDLEVSKVPQFLDRIGINSTEFFGQLNVFAQKMGAGANYDILDMLESEELKGVTIGMLAFQTEDKADYEVMVDEVVTMLEEASLYTLIMQGEDVSYIQEMVSSIIDMVEDSVTVSFATNGEGKLKAISIGADNFVYTQESSYHSGAISSSSSGYNGYNGYSNSNSFTIEMTMSFQLDILINTKIDVTWSDMVGDIENEIPTPTDEILAEADRAYTDYYSTSGYVQYKGQEYYYDKGQEIYGGVPNFDILTSVNFYPNCADWFRYEFCYVYEEFRFVMATIDVDGKPVNLIINYYTREVVEIIETENGFKAIYEDGTEKDIVMNMGDATSSDGLAKMYYAMFSAIFGEDAYQLDLMGRNVYFYYNPTTKEYSNVSAHAYVYEYILQGETCDEGVKVVQTCENCGYYNEYERRGCYNTEWVRIELSEHSACGGYVEGDLCSCCGRMYIYNSQYNCNFAEVSTEEIKDENDNVLGQRSVSVCENCGLTFIRENYKSEAGVCAYYTYETYYIYNGEECLVKQVYLSDIRAHKFVYSYDMEGETCYDGVTVTTTCENCDYYNESRYTSHYTLPFFALSNSGYGCDEHYVSVYGCPCGEEYHIYFEKDNFDYYDEEKGVYGCYNCDITVSYDQQESMDGCFKTIVTSLAVYNAAVELYSCSREETLEWHSFTSVQVSGADGNVEVITVCENCGEQKAYEMLTAYMGEEGYYDYYFTPNESGYYTIKGFATDDTYVTLYVQKDGKLGQLENGYGYNNNQFMLSYVLNAGETYVYRIRFYDNRTDGTIPFMLYREDHMDCNYNNGRVPFSQLMDGATSCEEGYIRGSVCVICGGLYDFTVGYEHWVKYNEIRLENYGACYGYIENYSCVCGQEGDGYYIRSCGSYSSNKYYDEGDRLVYVNSRYCEECGLRYDYSYYTIVDYANCTATTYYSVILSIGTNCILDRQYSQTQEAHDYEVTAELLGGAGSTCDDGVQITYTCKTCNDSYNYQTYGHARIEKERINLAEYGSVCGGYVTYSECACGYYGGLSTDHILCERDSKYTNLWIENAITDGQYNIENIDWYYGYSNNAWIYTCAVTDPVACAYKIRYASYWLATGDCYATEYETWQFGYNEETGTYLYEKTFKTGEYRVYHNYVANSTDNHVSYRCVDCGSTYEMVTTYDEQGNQASRVITIKHNLNDDNYRDYQGSWEYAYHNGSQYTSHQYVTYTDANGEQHWEEIYRTRGDYTGVLNLPFEYTTFEETYKFENSYGEHEDRQYAYFRNTAHGEDYNIYEYQKDRGGYWYRYDYVYDFSECCMRTTTYTNSYGENDTHTECCCRMYSDTIKGATCTQDGLRGYACVVCGKLGETSVISPNDHNWVQVTENWYYCYTCGLENKNGASGSIIMEDLTEVYGNGENYVVGYYAQNNVQFEKYVSLFFENDPDNEIIVGGVKFFEIDGLRAFAFNKAYVEEWAAAEGYTDYEIRFAFVPYGGDSSFDYAITFAERKSAGTEITGSTSFVDYVAEREYKSYTICPTENGVWTFTSRAEYDSFAVLYDANGNQLYSDDDGGYNTNFQIVYELQAGETYTLTVYWLNDSVASNMPIIIAVEPIA